MAIMPVTPRNWTFAETQWPVLLLKVTKQEYVAAGHDNNMVATQLECKCHSGLSYNVTPDSWAQLSATAKCQNSAVCIGADWKWQRRFSTRRGKMRRIHTHWSALELYTIWLVNFYKSSSARLEKTRPVAILSTTLQPYFRFHSNATCAVCVRTYMGEELRKKNLAKFYFRAFSASAYLQMFLKSYRQYLSHFWRIYLSEESARKERGRGQQEQ